MFLVIDNIVDDGSVFFFICLVNFVFIIDMGDWMIGWNFDDIEFVDVVEFFGFGGCCIGYVGQFFVEVEIVLEGD